MKIGCFKFEKRVKSYIKHAEDKIVYRYVNVVVIVLVNLHELFVHF